MSISIFNYYSRFAEIFPVISGVADANLLISPGVASFSPLFSLFPPVRGNFTRHFGCGGREPAQNSKKKS